MAVRGPAVSAPELRPYQLEVMGRLEKEISERRRRILLPAPTGSGKTVIAAAAIDNAVRHGQRVLFVAHRRELISQTSQKLHALGIDHGIIQAGFPSRPSARVQVASIQTLHARAVRCNSIELHRADLLFLDECHHARARTYMRVISAYPDAVILGLTATPCRRDGRGLGNIFEALVECPSVAELIAGGFLVGTKVYAPIRPDLSGIELRQGDYIESQLAVRMDTQGLVGDIVTHWHRLAERRRTVIFATSVAHSVHIRDELRRSGVWAEHIDGSTPVDERDAILDRLAEGAVEVVCNCMVLAEGWDCPEVSCVVLARPTKSLGLYLQMVGRVLRPSPGKSDAIFIDHAGAVFEHGFVEDPIIWTLHEDRRAENSAHRSRGRHHQAPALTTCPECAAVRSERRPCAQCGWQPSRKPSAVEVVDGELGEVGRDRKLRALPIDKVVFHRQLTWIARQRGYKRGWVGHKYRERFGEWPQDYIVEPMVPDAATTAWVRSRQIAFAKRHSTITEPV